MTVQTLKLGRERYVLMREKDFRTLKDKAKTSKPRKSRRLSDQDRGDIAEAKRRKNESSIPLTEVRKRLGL
ncbi:MAG TPA: hypothetical protein VKK61_03130 [Tepidisphaeraceae bacterium]|jgi:hypothetical protein|nr:hypothetical protein [Tepidisphaeraceae bacterium]